MVTIDAAHYASRIMTVFERIEQVLHEIRDADGFPIRNGSQWSKAAKGDPRWLAATLGKKPRPKSMRPENIEALANAIGLHTQWLAFGTGAQWKDPAKAPQSAPRPADVGDDAIWDLIARCRYDTIRVAVSKFFREQERSDDVRFVVRDYATRPFSGANEHTVESVYKDMAAMLGRLRKSLEFGEEFIDD